MRIIAVALSCWIGVAVAAPAEGEAVQGSGFMPEEFESFTLILLRQGEAWSDEDTPENDRLQAEHLVHLERMWLQGKAVVCGPFDEQDDPGLRGLCLYRVGVEEARALAEADPRVQAGQLRVEALTWWTGKGHLAFPLAPTDEVRGTAYDAKGGAVIEAADGRVVYVQGLDCWPEELSGSPVIARGRLVEESYLPEATVASDGAISQGVTAGSLQWVLKAASWEAAP